MLQQLDEDLWTFDQDIKLGLMRFPVRMTLARLPGGQLWVHSPVPLTDELAAEVQELGQVKYLVAPNNFHHMYIGDWHQHFPDSEMWLAPGVAKKRPELSGRELGEETPWSAHLETIPVLGANNGETVFIHRPSQSLLVADLFFNVRHHDSWMVRTTFGLTSSYGKFAQSRAWKLFVKQKQPYVDTLRHIIDAKPRNVVPAHGSVQTEDVPQAIEAAVSRWL